MAIGSTYMYATTFLNSSTKKIKKTKMQKWNPLSIRLLF